MLASSLILAIVAADVAPQAPTAPDAPSQDRPTVIVVVGHEGDAEYGRMFRSWAERWREAAEQGQATYAAIGLGEDPGGEEDRDRLQEQLAAAAKQTSTPLWLVLIGHGTFDGKTARFNARGSDFSSAELRQWLAPVERPMVIACCFSSSAPFLPELSGDRRVVISATRSGYEHNLSRFGEHLSGAIADPAADLDKDDQTSVLEAFLQASARLAEFYESDARLASEHPLLDDNADRLGTQADWFKGVRAIKTAKDGASPDGLVAVQLALVPSDREERLTTEQRARRDELEQQLAQLRQRKADLGEDEYLALIEPVLIELAKLYESADASEETSPTQKGAIDAGESSDADATQAAASPSR